VIQRSLQDPLAEMMLSGEVLDGQTGPEGLLVGARVSRSNRTRPEGVPLQ
jgi:ATP-dependent Clp protease ATP-binding subunit ClpB